MRSPLIALLLAVSLVSGCGFRESSANPFNWFRGASKSQEDGLAPKGGYKKGKLDNRGPVAQIENVTMERVPGGVILRATGLPPTQGWWDAELKAENDGRPVEGVLTYHFLIAGPHQQSRVSTVPSREVMVAAFISDIRLANTREIVIIGADGNRTIRP